MDNKKKKSRKPKNDDQETPEYLRNFIDSVSLKNAQAYDAAKKKKHLGAKRKKSLDVEEDVKQVKRNQGHQFTEMEIMTLWNSFKIEFPEGQINRLQLVELIQGIFPKCDADIVITNLFKVFDTEGTGRVVPNELLMAFSMSMKGSVADKLHWTFKLYDKDGSGEIDPEEMEEIFTKLCKIAEGTEMDQTRKAAKIREQNKIQEQELLEKQREAELKRTRDEMLNGKPKVVLLLSERMKRLGKSSSLASVAASAVKADSIGKQAVDDANSEPEEKKGKGKIMELMRAELEDPERDCKRFDPGKRARELFNALDDDGNGFLTEDEFVEGCMSDAAFVKVLEDFSGDFIWGSDAKKIEK